MSFFDVQFQARGHRLIQSALACGRLSHSFVFHGPSGVGKEMFARRMSKVLMCGNQCTVEWPEDPAFSELTTKPQDACSECEDCHLVDTEGHPDLHVVHRGLARFHPDPTIRGRIARDLSVDVVRHFVIDAVGAKPKLAQAKVFIIRDADEITRQAQNALLKTLEEPPDTTYLVLLVRSLDRLLATTRSRCQVIPFTPLPASFIAQVVRQHRPEESPDIVRLAAEVAQGSMDTALQLCDDNVGQWREMVAGTIHALRSVDQGDLVKRWTDGSKELAARFREDDKAITDVEAQRRGLRILLMLAAHEIRSMLLQRSREADVDALDRMTDAVGVIATAERQLSANVNVSLCLDSLAIRLSRLLDPATIGV
jgi:DNA polymerase-3 subunit delta'